MVSGVSNNAVFSDVSLQLQDLVLDHPRLEDFLKHLARYAAARLSSPKREFACGISVVPRRRTATMASSDPSSELMGQLQQKHADGPSLAALRTGAIVSVPDLGTEERWPRYIRATSGLGIQSLLAVPLRLPDADAAVLTLFCRQPGAFRREETMRIEAFARHASKNVGLAVRLNHLQDARDNMSAAMNTRTVIDLATGAIMARKRCSQDAAFQVLLHASNTRNIKLRDVAATVVTSISGSAAARTHFDE